MKRISLAFFLAASAAILSASPAAQAADGAMCYSGVASFDAGSETINYPQFSNTTTFACGSNIPTSTIKQLSALGWIIVAIDEVPYSQSVDADGKSISKSRLRLIIQR